MDSSIGFSLAKSDMFLDDLAMPCLVGRIRNSEIPGIAAEHLRKSKNNPWCEVFLRSRKPTQITPWQRRYLNSLFVDGGMAKAFRSGMEQYKRTVESGEPAYSGASRKELAAIEKGGIAHYMIAMRVVIDDIAKEVIIDARTELDVSLIEHGINIFLKSGRWKFDHADYLIRYLESVEFRTKRNTNNVTSAHVRRVSWRTLFPAPERGTPIVKCCDELYGKWDFDKSSTEAIMRKLGIVENQIEAECANSDGNTYEFAPGKMRVVGRSGAVRDMDLIDCQRCGNQLKIKVKIHVKQGMQVITGTDMLYIMDGKLVDRKGRVMKRV